MIDRGSSLDQLLRRCSSWPRLITLVAWLLRFINHIQNKGTEKRRISLSEMSSSSKKIVQLVQRQTRDVQLNVRAWTRQTAHSVICPTGNSNLQPASHMSGVWERLIRSVCKTMKAILGNPNALIGLEALRTVFAEVVIILNSRPLSPSSDDPNDPEPLTQNHLLLQKKHLALPPGLFVHEDLFGRKQWRRAPVPC